MTLSFIFDAGAVFFLLVMGTLLTVGIPLSVAMWRDRNVYKDAPISAEDKREDHP